VLFSFLNKYAHINWMCKTRYKNYIQKSEELWKTISGKLTRLTLYTTKAIIVPHWIIRSWYTGRWWVSCYIWYSEEGPGRAGASPSPLLTVPNVTAHPSTASVPIIVLLYDSSLLCGFNVAIKGLRISLLHNTITVKHFTSPTQRTLQLTPGMKAKQSHVMHKD